MNHCKCESCELSRGPQTIMLLPPLVALYFSYTTGVWWIVQIEVELVYLCKFMIIIIILCIIHFLCSFICLSCFRIFVLWKICSYANQQWYDISKASKYFIRLYMENNSFFFFSPRNTVRE